LAFRPARRLDDFQRITAGHQDLRQQRIRIERDRRQYLVELFRLEALAVTLCPRAA
jgi:hypothetical protein